jgi:hypothetical protein
MSTESRLSWLRPLAEDMQRLLERAYQTGRADMRRELMDLLGNGGTTASPPPANNSPARVSAKVPPGTVKPAILDLIETSNGIRTDTIITTTGFKENSVRGTLSALMAEGKIKRAANGFWVKNAEAPANAEASWNPSGSGDQTGAD